MSEETTHNLPDRRSFEERVFARFDAIDAGLRDLNGRMETLETRMGSLETRVQRLEDESARRAADTKPIWERALNEIIAVREKVDALAERVDAVERKLDVFWQDMLTLRAEQRQLGKRMDKLEAKPAS
jgi:chromosome segregation ATPase